MEGPYRDLGGGFARLTGGEGSRRSPSRISTVEDALLELLRNARDAGARHVYVASTLRRRRYRSLTVIDDGHGIPESHKALVFEPGVTSRHLDSAAGAPGEPGSSHRAGLSLYHLKAAALEAAVLSARTPTALRATFDTEALPERSLQSSSRPSKSNLLATLGRFAAAVGPEVSLYYASPARILATLYARRIIQPRPGLRRSRSREVARGAQRLGLAVSVRTVQRVLTGEIEPARRVQARQTPVRQTREGNATAGSRERERREGPVLRPAGKELLEIEDILGRIARARYLRIGEVELQARAGELALRVSVYEPEEEYE